MQNNNAQNYKIEIKEFTENYVCTKCRISSENLGGELTIGNEVIKMCNSCFIEIQLSINSFIKNKEQIYCIPNFSIEKINKQNSQTSNYALKIHSHTIEINAAQFKLLQSVLNKYNKFQYETCGVALDEQDDVIRELINQWKAPLQQVEENRSKLKAKCEELVYRTEEADDDLPEPNSAIPNPTFIVLCSIEDVFCTVIDTFDKAKLLLLTHNDSLFNFAFSFSRAYDLAEILLEFYENDNLAFSQNRTITIKIQAATKRCLVCGKKKEFEYETSFGNKRFSLCSKCFQKLINAVYSNAIAYELFPPLYSRYKKVKKEKEKNNGKTKSKAEKHNVSKNQNNGKKRKNTKQEK